MVQLACMNHARLDIHVSVCLHACITSGRLHGSARLHESRHLGGRMWQHMVFSVRLRDVGTFFSSFERCWY
jgi:hypothetical protein